VGIGLTGIWGFTLRTVLVCVRTPLAAQTIANCAARLGLGTAVRTAASEVEMLARLADWPADILLVDAALTRPDPAAFTRRALGRAPRATLVLLGEQDRAAARDAVVAGARGVVRGTGQDLVTVVTKALLLLTSPGNGTAGRGNDAPAATPSPSPASPPSTASPSPGRTNAPVVPQQRGPAPNRGPGRRLALTARELQVLRAMADGKSNAQIGRELFVSEDTIKTHARRLFRKLGARDRAHAVAAGFRAGLVS
jgi:DNA-binding NarL/FixJ family response regulator